MLSLLRAACVSADERYGGPPRAVKGAARKEYISPRTYTAEDAQAELERIRTVQQSDDKWLDLSRLSTKGSNIVVVYVQEADAPRPTEDRRSPEELLERLQSLGVIPPMEPGEQPPEDSGATSDRQGD